MSTHTPGPWHVSELDYRTIGPRRIVGQGTMGEVPQLQAVARVTERMDETAANAHLIAAAPELLEALYGLGEQVVASHNGWCFDSCADNGIVEGHSPRCAAARAAIAKAEGR